MAVSVALLLRIVLLWASHYHEDRNHPKFETVGLETLMVADSLAHGKGFSHPFPGYDAITAWIAPGYPFLWALGIRLFRLGDLGKTVFAQAMNSVFSAATCLPIFAIGKRIFGERVGLASAWLWAFLPYAILMPLEWMWDQSLATLLLAAIVSATFALSESASPLHWTWYGLLWALAAMVNPTLCILLPFFLGWLVFGRSAARESSFHLAFRLAGRAVLVFVLALMPWTIRNYYAIGGPVFVKSNFGLELWLGNNSAVQEVYSADFHPASNFSQRLKLAMHGEITYNRAKQQEAIAYIEENPRKFVKNLSTRFADIWAATYDSRVEPWILALGLSRADVWFCTTFSILSFVGLILAVRSCWQESLPLVMCLLLFPIPYYLTHTALRYRHPIDPLMAILGTYALARLWTALRSGDRNQYESHA